MIAFWEAGRLLADRDAVAQLYHVSARTVRRRCRPVGTDPATGTALYDAHAAAGVLADVVARPDRTAAARRARAVLNPPSTMESSR